MQTLRAFFFPGRAPPYQARQHVVQLPDADQVILHDDCPVGWQIGHRTALLIHGLAGSHASPYVVRIAGKLNDRGVRTFRMDLRGCGAGAMLARFPYHSGRSDDAAAALAAIAEICPGSPASAIGFSLGGNIVLKLLGEVAGNPPPGNLDSGVAVCPPIDLTACVRSLGRPINRFYDRYFVDRLLADLRRRRQCVAGLMVAAEGHERSILDRPLPRRLFDFDDRFTAPVSGFGSAENYYRLCSSASLISSIRLPTLIIAARNDPMIPVAAFEGISPTDSTRILIADSGGHLGFWSKRSNDPDRWWMDWRVVEWVTARLVD